MNTTTRITAITAVVALLASIAVVADSDDVRRLAETRISLIEAIEIAEQHQGGKAFDASLDDDSFTPEYEIEVAVGEQSFEVTVDGVTGEVRRVKEDRDD